MGVAGRCPEMATRGIFFIVIWVLQGVGAGNCAIRDQNKGLKLSFLQSFTHPNIEGCALAYILWIQELMNSSRHESYNLVLKRYSRDFLQT